MKSCSPGWCWVVFTVALVLNRHDLMKAAAIELACAALTSPVMEVVTAASVALRASDSEVKNQLELLWKGISKAVHEAKAPSEALLVVLLMRMNQFIKDGSNFNSLTGTAYSSLDTLQPLGDSSIVELLKLVKWERLHHVEINALLSQAASYKTTAAAEFVKNALASQVCQRSLGDRSGLVAVEGLPLGQSSAARYLAAWVDMGDITKPQPTGGRTVAIATKGVAHHVKSGSIDIRILVKCKPSKDSSSLTGGKPDYYLIYDVIHIVQGATGAC
jgi:hypothetical protein